MPYRPYEPPAPLLVGYDPYVELPADHLCRLVEQVVEQTVQPGPRPAGPGQPPFDPRLPIKVLVYGYATGVRSSRALEAHCRESLPYLFLTRGDTPSYRTLCTVRVAMSELIEQVWVGLFAVAERAGIVRVGRLVVDSSKMRANASAESVLKAAEFEPVLAELQRILEEALQADEREERTGGPGSTRLGKSVPGEQMRDTLRRVRKQLAARKRAESEKARTDKPQTCDRPQRVSAGGPPSQTSVPSASDATVEAVEGATADVPSAEGHAPMTAAMRRRVKLAVDTIERAQEQEAKHACLTDPDARMMGEGRERRVRECHSYEVAVDNGLLVVGQAGQSPVDNCRLEPVVEAAKGNEPGGVVGVDADSGYFRGDTVAAYIQAGIDTCIPDSNTAADLHRGQPPGTLLAEQRGVVGFVYDADADCYRCPQGNALAPKQWREDHGQRVHVYRAEQECRGCALDDVCLQRANACHRTLKVGEHQALLQAALQRFADPQHVERYHRRADAVETVFGFLRAVLGYSRWLLRGQQRVQCEAQLFTLAYQLRKVHRHWHASSA